MTEGRKEEKKNKWRAKKKKLWRIEGRKQKMKKKKEKEDMLETRKNG
jgi:hypothetical protein